MQYVDDEIADLHRENERLLAFAESVRSWKRLPLWELTDTDRERAAAFRRQLEIHAEMARKALEGK